MVSFKTFNASGATTLALAIAGSLGSGMPASAQEPQRVSGLEEIVVTAQRREESLQETPIAVTAFTAGKLADLGAFDIASVADFAPNVTIAKQPSSNSNMTVTIRGLGMNETALTADPKVGLYLDGVYMSKTIGAVFDIAELERIEVLRGPQGTLFGRNTTGGAINVITRRPTGEFGARLLASSGNYGYLRYGAQLDLPALGDLSASIAFNHVETDGWARNHYRGVAQPPQRPTEKVERDLGSEDNDAYRIALRWTPRSDLTLDYTFDRTHNTGVAVPMQIVVVKDTVWSPFGSMPMDFRFLGGDLYQQMAQNVTRRSKRQKDFVLDEMTEEYLKIKAHTFTAAWEVTDQLTLKYLLGSRRSRHNTGSDLDGGAYLARDLFYGVYAGDNDPIQVPGFHSRIDDGRIEMDSHELQLIGTAFDERLHYTGGLFSYEEEVYENNPQTFSIPIAFLTPDGAATPELGPLYDAEGFCPPEYAGTLCIGTQRLPIPGAGDQGVPGVVDFAYGQKTRSQAIYGQATYAFTERLDATLGVRYTRDRKKAFLYNQNLVQTIPTHSRSNPVRGKENWSNVSYFANLNYALTDDVNAYLTYTTGYNSGGFNARASNLASFQTPYDEEELKAIELGVKSELLNNRLRLNAAMFYNDYADIQTAQSELGTGGASSRIVNAGKATIKGVELDVVAVPIDGLTIDLSYGYLDAKHDEFLERNPVTDMLEDISHLTSVPMAPRNTAALGVQYDFEPFSYGAWSARIDVSYRDKAHMHPYLNQWTSSDSHTLLNGRISLNDLRIGCCDDKSRMRVSLWGRNLSNENYVNFGIDFGTMGFAGVTLGEPRTYGIDVVYTYR